MATTYNDIITLRGGKAAYSITDEKSNEWSSFIPNDQFNTVLRTVLKSVRGNDIDNHKSFWINGTYGTGKSHAAAVISHLLCDDEALLHHWVDYEYGDEKYAQLRNAIYALRHEKRLLCVKLKGLNAMTHSSDLAPVLQKAVAATLKAHKIELCVRTDFETYIDHVNKNPEIWDFLIGNNATLASSVTNRDDLIDNLKGGDLKTFHTVSDVLRQRSLDLRMDNSNVMQWFMEIQQYLQKMGTYSGLLIVWDEFTDVMTDAIGVAVLKELQSIAERFMNADSNSFLFLISHPSAFDKMGSEQLKQTDGRYHRMKYNMEPVSAFKIMSRKMEVIDAERHETMCQQFYTMNPTLLDLYVQGSNDPQSTRDDLCKLYPLHPGTANLATHYATVVGSSSRSVFEFLGQNEAIREFLANEEHFMNSDTITADYLWDYVLKVFQDDVQSYGAVTERYNSYVRTVEAQGEAYMAIFKGVLLLNAFNNVSGDNNNGLITPSEENVHNLFDGTRYADAIGEVLEWFNTDGIIQRAPGGLYSVQFSALPSKEIEDKKHEMRTVQFTTACSVVNFAFEDAKNAVEKKMMQKVIRPYGHAFYSDASNESVLRNKIKNGRKATTASHLFFAFMVARNNEELSTLRTFAERCAADHDDKELKNIVYVVIDAVLGDMNYERFIEYQANHACAYSHGFKDQSTVHRDNAIAMVKEWLESMSRANATIYININDGESQALSMRNLSSIVNASISPLIYPYGPDAHDRLRQKSASTFWKPQHSKEIVRKFLFATSMEEIQDITAQMRPIQYLVQDCLDDNLEWKSDVAPEHPFKQVCDKVDSTIRHADKSLTFNFDDKFAYLTKPPYGLYNTFASMAMMAFALRPWIGKVFDLQGKPRDANALTDDIVLLFKVWEDGKNNAKLNFKFQTQEESKLCKELIKLFGLNSEGSAYKDVTSLKDARYAITADFLAQRGTPLWAIKYAPDSAFASLPVVMKVTDSMKQLLDNIVKICAERELRNPALVNNTLQLISELRIDMKTVLNVHEAFTEGFKAYLMQIPLANVQDNEIDEVKHYLEEHLESTLGYWTEEAVAQVAKDWRLDKKPQPQPEPQPQPTGYTTVDTELPSLHERPYSAPNMVNEKRGKARRRIEAISTVDDAKAILNKLCESGSEWVLDIINN